MAGVYGKFSYYPLRWSDAYFSTNSFVSALSSNPILYFSETLKNKESGYELAQSKKYYPVIAEYLGIVSGRVGRRAVAGRLDFTRVERSFSPIDATTKRGFGVPQIIRVLQRRVVGQFAMDPTADFDAMARKGSDFRSSLRTARGSARSVFTLITGIPDVEMVKTSTRNPMLVKQHSIINAFEGYEKFSSWVAVSVGETFAACFQAIFRGSSARAAVNFTAAVFSDLHLFEEANAVLRSRSEHLAVTGLLHHSRRQAWFRSARRRTRRCDTLRIRWWAI